MENKANLYKKIYYNQEMINNFPIIIKKLRETANK